MKFKQIDELCTHISNEGTSTVPNNLILCCPGKENEISFSLLSDEDNDIELYYQGDNNELLYLCKEVNVAEVIVFKSDGRVFASSNTVKRDANENTPFPSPRDPNTLYLFNRGLSLMLQN